MRHFFSRSSVDKRIKIGSSVLKYKKDWQWQKLFHSLSREEIKWADSAVYLVKEGKILWPFPTIKYSEIALSQLLLHLGDKLSVAPFLLHPIFRRIRLLHLFPVLVPRFWEGRRCWLAQKRRVFSRLQLRQEESGGCRRIAGTNPSPINGRGWVEGGWVGLAHFTHPRSDEAFVRPRRPCPDCLTRKMTDWSWPIDFLQLLENA